MNKKKFILLMVLVLAVSLIGCTQTDSGTKDKEKKEVSAETIQEILIKAKNIKNIEYEVSMTLNNTPMPMNMKVYQKEKKYKIIIEFMGQKQIGIFDGKNMYTYNSKKDVYYKMETTDISNNTTIDFEDFAEQALNDVSMKELGKEKVNGMQTRIIEFNYSGKGEEAKKTKAWFSEKYGIPIKLEANTTTNGEEMKSTMTLKNIKVNSVSDSVFEVPEDKIKPYGKILENA